MNNEIKAKILNPFTLLAYVLTILSIIFLYDGHHLYPLLAVSIACIIKFVSMERVYTCLVALITTFTLISPTVTVLNGEYIYILLMLAILSNIIPMYWYILKNKNTRIYQ